MTEHIKIYTDGACSGNPGAGGWAAIGFWGEKKLFETCGSLEETTNNRMELLAVISGIETIANIFENCSVAVYSDSAYVVNAMNQSWIENWQKKNWRNAQNKVVANKDLWEEFITLLQYAKGKNIKIKFHKVKGHSSDVKNEMCDELAKDAIRRDYEK